MSGPNPPDPKPPNRKGPTKQKKKTKHPKEQDATGLVGPQSGAAPGFAEEQESCMCSVGLRVQGEERERERRRDVLILGSANRTGTNAGGGLGPRGAVEPPSTLRRRRCM